jgi:MFS family permease
MIPFLYYQDPYVCRHPIKGDNCQAYVCGLSASDRSGYIPAKTMNTLSNKFGDFRCPNEKLQIDAVISLTYIGAIAGSFIISFIGDLIGRKFLLTLSLVFTVLGFIVVIFCESLIMAGAGLFMVSVGVQNAFNICFYFISEITS